MVIPDPYRARNAIKIQEWTVPTGQSSCRGIRVNRRCFPDTIWERASEQVALPSSNVREFRNNHAQFFSYSYPDTGLYHRYHHRSHGHIELGVWVEGSEVGVGYER